MDAFNSHSTPKSDPKPPKPKKSKKSYILGALDRGLDSLAGTNGLAYGIATSINSPVSQPSQPIRHPQPKPSREPTGARKVHSPNSNANSTNDSSKSCSSTGPENRPHNDKPRKSRDFIRGMLTGVSDSDPFGLPPSSKSTKHAHSSVNSSKESNQNSGSGDLRKFLTRTALEGVANANQGLPPHNPLVSHPTATPNTASRRETKTSAKSDSRVVATPRVPSGIESVPRVRRRASNDSLAETESLDGLLIERLEGMGFGRDIRGKGKGKGT
ncbi:hypothetical protein K491DRAFT_732753 [Lophiostoma macrostomum CBS 122681]|uniref:Uncharacterized protein n=1 Tax=Lophiostoma macrostomum CBS 122681 TaxID=1314788 RepID=A0A6A6SQ21_9PLEO|nr:hypothetical protein K491DRAFT_732753 [Lophiostoma macrostomum CBS 122681]